MWEKWVFLATLAASTSVMRAPLGHILASPGGREFLLGVRDECSSVAAAAGYAPRETFLTRITGMLTTEGSQLTASMFRDIKVGGPIEADQIVGDLIARADAAKAPVPRLRVVYTHLKAYERQRA
jgi:2-dehydropantoate 2-reductase